MPAIVISEFMDGDAVARLAAAHETVFDPNLVDDRPRLIALLADAQAIVVRNRTQVDEALLAAAPSLKAVGRLGVGLDNINVSACQVRDIAVLPATGANAIAVAEYVIAAALRLVRPVFDSRDAVVAGRWPRAQLQGGELAGRVMGLVGFGGIARAVAERARAFGMTVAAHDPLLDADDPIWATTARRDLPSLLAEADVLSLHVPLTADTKGLFGETTLAAMKPGAILVNTARGGIVDETALAQALRSGKLGGAALDVFEHEPLDEANGAIFEGAPNLLLTPHIAGVTRESNVAVSNVTASNVLRALA